MKKLLVYIIMVFCSTNLFANGFNNLFIPNKGQWADSIVALYKQENLNIWIANNAIYFDQYTKNKVETSLDDFDKNKILKYSSEGRVIKHEFLYSNYSNIEIVYDSSAYFNYFIGNDKSKHQSKVNKIKSLKINDIYQGVSVLYYIENNNLRYDYIISPEANPNNIQIKISRAELLTIGENEIATYTKTSILKNQELLSYQIIDNKKQLVNSRFVEKDGIVTIYVENYDKSKELIIDPLVYSTFFGGSNYDDAETLQQDSIHNLYICGYTSSVEFPTTTGAYSTDNISAPFDYPSCFFSKFDSLGNLVFSTFFGGYWDNYAKDFQIDSKGNYIIAGYTASITTFPTTAAAYDTIGNGGYDAFVVKLSADGSKLLYSTLIGGTKDDYTMGVALDRSDNPYIVGYTTHTGSYPVSDDAIQKVHNGKYDAFITKFDSTCSNILYSTYLGGTDNDFGQDIALDTFGYAYITGFTRSMNFPVTFNGYNRVYQDTVTDEERGDAFISKITPNGKTLFYSTYFGGKSKDGAYSILLDSLNNVYLTGYTESADFPVTPNAYDKIYSKNNIESSKGDAFCFKLNTFSNILYFSTFIGGSASDRAWSMNFDDSLNIFITGTSSSVDFPFTKNCIDSIINDEDFGSDAFVCKLSADGSNLTYSTLIGGHKPDVGKSIIHFKDSTYYLSGITSSPDFPITKNAYDTLLNSSQKQDIFMSMVRITPYIESLHFEFETDIGTGIHRAVICKSDSIRVKINYSGGVGNVMINWAPESGVSNPTAGDIILNPNKTTKYTVTLVDALSGVFTDTLLIEVIELPNINIVGPKIVMRNSKQTYSVEYQSGTIYTWQVQGGQILSGDGTNSIEVKWYDSTINHINLYAVNYIGCPASSGNVNISVGNYFYVELNYSDTPNMTICKGDTLYLKTMGVYSDYNWSDGTKDRTVIITKAGVYWVVVADNNGIIGYSDTLYVIEIDKPAKPKIKNNNGTLQCTIIAAGYQWYLNGKMVDGAINKSFTPTEFGNFQVEVNDIYGCRNISDILYYSDIYEISSLPDINVNYDSDLSIIRIYYKNGINFAESKIRLINILGQLNYTRTADADYLEIDLTEYEQGIYFLTISFSEENYFYKIIK